MYSTLDSNDAPKPSGLKRLARRDLPGTARTPLRAPEPAAFEWPTVDIVAVFRWLRGGILWMAILLILGAAAGYGYSVLALPKFTASTDMIIDPSNLQVVTDDLYKNPMDQNAQLLDVESKLRVLTSGNVLSRVVTQLDLQDDPEFTQSPGMFGLPFLATGSDTPDRNPSLAAQDALAKRISAWREERSYVVTVAVTTANPDKSVRVANAVVDAFQSELARAEADGASRAADALMDRLGELKASVTKAEDAVETFKRSNGLQESNGEYVSAQSMTLLNSRAVDAQQALIEAESHYSELTDPVTGAANADAVQTDTMVALRTQLGLLRQQVDANATMYGPRHPNRTAAERQLSGLQQQIAAEASRAVQSAKLELDQAKRNVAQFTEQTSAARTTVATDDQADVQLRELERDAKAKAAIYEAFLTRAGQVTERQQLDTTNIRIISPATPPGVRSWPPRGVLMAAGGGFGGLALGIALALGLGFLGDSRRLRKS